MILLPESGKIIHSLKLKFGVLERWRSLLQCWTRRGSLCPNARAKKTQLLSICAMSTYIIITFLRNAYHINGFSRNSLAYVNVLCACLLAPLGGRQGSSDEGSSSLSWWPLADRITESQNVGGWKRPLWVTQPNPLPKQGHLQ